MTRALQCLASAGFALAASSCDDVVPLTATSTHERPGYEFTSSRHSLSMIKNRLSQLPKERLQDIRSMQDVFAAMGPGEFSAEKMSELSIDVFFFDAWSQEKYSFLFFADLGNAPSSQAIMIATPKAVANHDGERMRIVIFRDLELGTLSEQEFHQSIWDQSGQDR